MQSPFKLLDAYTLEDRDVFFGRDQEVKTLYELVNRNKLILIYGESGTGKTSLIQCGLASRFDITDWYPIFVRRGDDMVQSLRYTLQQAAEEESEDIVELMQDIYTLNLRPIYLILDQFEELLILGDAAERREMIRQIDQIYRASLPCRVLIILRKEYLANLFDFEQAIPTFFDRRMMVEPMTYAKVAEVIGKSCEQFNITLEGGQESIGRILENISGGKSEFPLPYLQVYLDMLYRRSFARQYPNGTDGDLPPIQVKAADIDALGRIENVLKEFLQEQQIELQTELQQQHPELPADTVARVLDTFVTDQGTKRAIGFTIEDELVRPNEHAPESLSFLSLPVLTTCLRELEKRRLLRANEASYELAHDSLAAIIDRNRSDEQRLLNEMRNYVKSWLGNYERFNTYATEKQLLSIEEFLPKLNLSAPEKQFLQASRQEVEARKNEALQAERSKRRRATIFAVVGFTLAALAIVATFFAMNAQRATEVALTEAQEARDQAQVNQELAEAARDTAQSALNQLQREEAERVMINVNDIVQRADNLRQRYPIIYQELIGDARRELAQYPDNPYLVEELQKLRQR